LIGEIENRLGRAFITTFFGIFTFGRWVCAFED
jgi:hypothetical protein